MPRIFVGRGPLNLKNPEAPDYFFLYLLLKRSMRPSVSISLALPVKKGWQLEQISTLISSLVARVSMTLPQAQLTLVST